MPMRQSSSTVQPCRMTPCPTVTRAPTVVWEKPPVMCTIEPSWMLLSSPTTMRPSSPRRVAQGQMLARAPSVTCPMTTAAGCT